MIKTYKQAPSDSRDIDAFKYQRVRVMKALAVCKDVTIVAEFKNQDYAQVFIDAMNAREPVTGVEGRR